MWKVTYRKEEENSDFRSELKTNHPYIGQYMRIDGEVYKVSLIQFFEDNVVAILKKIL